MRNYPQTAETLARARAHQREERDRVYQQTGLRIVDGFPLETRAVVIIHCPRCQYAATARQEGQAIRHLSAHLVRAHLEPRHARHD